MSKSFDRRLIEKTIEIKTGRLQTFVKSGAGFKSTVDNLHVMLQALHTSNGIMASVAEGAGQQLQGFGLGDGCNGTLYTLQTLNSVESWVKQKQIWMTKQPSM